MNIGGTTITELVRVRSDAGAPQFARRNRPSFRVARTSGDDQLHLERSLKWNPATEDFGGDEQANRLRSRAMREPWRV